MNWGHPDAAYPHYILTTLTMGKEVALFDGYSLKELQEQVHALADAMKERRKFCICKEPEKIKP
ncbi:MAG: hypothetical protein K6T73_01260 [Candidatus Bathyarchaeota archaeon]|nr:hypothetical protein [Candidatus Bathyarchaeota archaeon]